MSNVQNRFLINLLPAVLQKSKNPDTFKLSGISDFWVARAAYAEKLQGISDFCRGLERGALPSEVGLRRGCIMETLRCVKVEVPYGG